MLRKLLSVLSLAALVAVLPLQAADAKESERSVPLTVMAFNIHHGAGTDGVLDLNRIADVIADSGADIVALQEVDNHWSERSDWADQAAELADKLGYHHAYGANLDRDPPEGSDDRRQYGTAVLSRFPITASENTLLHHPEGTEQRGLLHAEIDVNGVTVNAYSTHFEHTSSEARMQQAQDVIDIVGDTRHAVIMGDYNALPGAAEIELLDDPFTDAWTDAGQGDGSTYPAEDADRRIDYIFLSKGVEATKTQVVQETPEASDHLPVISNVVIDS